MSDQRTAPPDEPEGAVAALFGARADLARGFWTHLATTAVERGLIGPREVPRLWDRHILNCAAVADLVPENANVVDVGSGAGLPGVAVAIARPDVRVTLVEPLQRRVLWLEEVISELGLQNVTTRRARAEEVRELGADVATARAVAALPVLAGWCLPLVRVGGRLLAVKGRTAPEELAAAEDALRALGAVEWAIRTVGAEVLDEPTTVVEVVAGDAPGRGANGARRGRGRRGEPPGGKDRAPAPPGRGKAADGGSRAADAGGAQAAPVGETRGRSPRRQGRGRGRA